MKFETNKHLFTPAESQKFLDINYEKNRNIRQGHVNHLANCMLNGSFVPNFDIRIAMVNNSPVLIDGQHRLSAIIKSGVSFWMPLQTNYCQSDDDIRKLYANCDAGASRTFKDRARAYHFDEKMGILLSEVGRIKSSVSFMHNPKKGHVNKNFYSVEGWLSLCEDWVDQFCIYKNCASSSVLKSKTMSSPVLSVALITIKYAEALAIDFWSGVCNDDGLLHGDPRKTLHKYIMVHSLSSQKNNSGKGTSRYALYVACVKSWNNWVGGKKMKSIGKLGEDTPISLTPYDGTYESLM